MTIGAILMPVLMVVGFIAAWKMPKREGRRDQGQTWRDTSLDDWRKERDAALEAERQQRIDAGPALHDNTGAEASEPVRHQRLGG